MSKQFCDQTDLGAMEHDAALASLVQKKAQVHKVGSEGGRERQGWRSTGWVSYLRLHGPVHGGGLGGGAAIGERFRGAGRQRGLLGRRGNLRGALNVLTVPFISLMGEIVRDREGRSGETPRWLLLCRPSRCFSNKNQAEGNHSS